MLHGALPFLGPRRPRFALETERLVLRPPRMDDHAVWVRLRRDSAPFLKPWEPVWAPDHFTRAAFRNRVRWAERMVEEGRGLPMFLFRASDDQLLGALTLDNLRRGPAQAATLGYWIGEKHARRGYMAEALGAVRDHAFGVMGLSRLEAATLPENAASRGLLERSGFRHEGRAEAYLQIGGRWRDHVLYAALRGDRLPG
ncbi:GNAT family N-acetyltransferase [Rhodovulum sp. DZ06]|uniref:GNAT family N-acetyltransferase n=1 Tax=Rhodovulum sp. DZ06 TaxID=3425126 RepID=UPI003D35783E